MKVALVWLEEQSVRTERKNRSVIFQLIKYGLSGYLVGYSER